MSFEITGEAIKSATSIRLGEIFKVPTGQVDSKGNPTYTYPIRYKENITNQQYPNFHIIQVNSSITPRQTKYQGPLNNDLRRLQLDYLVNIQYRFAEDTEAVSNLRQQLDGVGLKLMAEFDHITLDKVVYTKNCRYEIVDGVLQFFFNITIFATTDQVNETKMNDLKENTDLDNKI